MNGWVVDLLRFLWMIGSLSTSPHLHRVPSSFPEKPEALSQAGFAIKAWPERCELYLELLGREENPEFPGSFSAKTPGNETKPKSPDTARSTQHGMEEE